MPTGIFELRSQVPGANSSKRTVLLRDDSKLHGFFGLLRLV